MGGSAVEVAVELARLSFLVGDLFEGVRVYV